jgi:predicted nucleic acid-binding protein
LGLTPLRAFLARHRRIALDTSVFIYYLEANPAYVDLAGEVFAWLERPPNTAVTSTLTMTELLVQPYRASNERLVNQYYGLLSLFPNLEWVAPDLAIADTAARIRAQHRLRTPDALQVATAIHGGASAILTNDSDMARVAEVDVEVLDRLR